MPRARTTDPSTAVWTTSSREGRPKPRPRLPLFALGAALLAVLWASNFTSWGRTATAHVFVVVEFYIGVVVLVMLSITVMAGLASTDRVLLRIRHRVLFQSAHRVTAIIAVTALGVHVPIKILEAHASVGDAVVPFFSQDRSRFVGFGTIAAYLLLTAFLSGLARTRFAGRRRPWLWRVVHSSAYLAWPVALVHGLGAGRPAAAWVIVSYIVCVLLVALGLLVRLFSTFGRYAGGVKETNRAVGVNVQTVVMPRVRDVPAYARMPVAATEQRRELYGGGQGHYEDAVVRGWPDGEWHDPRGKGFADDEDLWAPAGGGYGGGSPEAPAHPRPRADWYAPMSNGWAPRAPEPGPGPRRRPHG
jgi:hypothetical protein